MAPITRDTAAKAQPITRDTAAKGSRSRRRDAIGREGLAWYSERVAPGGAKRPADTITARVIVTPPLLANVEIMADHPCGDIVH
jgi:hypothetical protein